MITLKMTLDNGFVSETSFTIEALCILQAKGLITINDIKGLITGQDIEPVDTEEVAKLIQALREDVESLHKENVLIHGDPTAKGWSKNTGKMMTGILHGIEIRERLNEFKEKQMQHWIEKGFIHRANKVRDEFDEFIKGICFKGEPETRTTIDVKLHNSVYKFRKNWKQRLLARGFQNEATVFAKQFDEIINAAIKNHPDIHFMKYGKSPVEEVAPDINYLTDYFEKGKYYASGNYLGEQIKTKEQADSEPIPVNYAFSELDDLMDDIEEEGKVDQPATKEEGDSARFRRDMTKVLQGDCPDCEEVLAKGDLGGCFNCQHSPDEHGIAKALRPLEYESALEESERLNEELKEKKAPNLFEKVMDDFDEKDKREKLEQEKLKSDLEESEFTVASLRAAAEKMKSEFQIPSSILGKVHIPKVNLGEIHPDVRGGYTGAVDEFSRWEADKIWNEKPMVMGEFLKQFELLGDAGDRRMYPHKNCDEVLLTDCVFKFSGCKQCKEYYDEDKVIGIEYALPTIPYICEICFKAEPSVHVRSNGQDMEFVCNDCDVSVSEPVPGKDCMVINCDNTNVKNILLTEHGFEYDGDLAICDDCKQDFLDHIGRNQGFSISMGWDQKNGIDIGKEKK